jgi:D-alanine-D-alanine ligase
MTPTTTSADDLIILFGSDSNERRVSVASAQNVARVLPDSTPWFWAPDGAVYVVDRDRLMGWQRPFETDFDPGVKARYPSVLAALDDSTPAATFILSMHGGAGEDGTVQAWMEERHLFFTGSSAAASRRAFDKNVSKQLVLGRGVRIAESQLLRGDRLEQARTMLPRLLERAGRLVLKPVASGSSVGVSFIDSAEGIEAGLEQLRREPKLEYLAEVFISGTELTVGVYDEEGGRRRALPCSEVRVERGRAFDFAGKYLGLGTREITPAEVPPEVHREAGAVAIAAHEATGCLGYSRTDVIATENGVVFIEINNLPGLTAASFYPQQLAVAGISMEAFFARQIELARTRYMEAEEPTLPAGSKRVSVATR